MVPVDALSAARSDREYTEFLLLYIFSILFLSFLVCLFVFIVFFCPLLPNLEDS